MEIFQTICAVLVITIHIYIVILEMFLWTSKKGIKIFGLKSKEFAEETEVLAANQGLYNGFLVAGFIWGLVTQNLNVLFFFFCCVFVAGFYGAYSTKKIRILYFQSIPALIGILSILL